VHYSLRYTEADQLLRLQHGVVANIIEKMHMTSRLLSGTKSMVGTRFCGRKKSAWKIRSTRSTCGKSRDSRSAARSDKLGIAKTAREEKTRARDAKLAATRGNQKNDAAMTHAWRNSIGSCPEESGDVGRGGFIPLTAIAPAAGNGIPTEWGCEGAEQVGERGGD